MKRFVRGSLLAVSLMTSTAWAQDDGMDMSGSDTTPAAEPTTKEEAPVASTEGGGSSWMKDWHIGPALTLSIPHPINYGIEAGYKKNMSFGFQTGSYTFNFGSDAEVKISNWDLRGRWHPFEGTFFVGLAYGNQTLSAEASKKVDVSGAKNKTTMSIDVDTVYTTPHIGWIDATESGFLFGFELGYQIANSSKAKNLKITTDAAAPNPAGTKEYKDLQKNVEDAAETIGKKSIPYLGFKFGWMF